MLLKRAGNDDPDTKAHEAGEISILVVRAGSHSTVTVTGRVTVDSSPHLRSVLLELLRRPSAQVVIIDVLAVAYLDMSGLATLLEALQAAQRNSVTLRVVGMTGQGRMLAEIAELDAVFRAAGSEVEFR
ncbi:MAG TPA: STAS domain-containing protein [Bryobacteraceae bacterium]|nr:STAS domain-containing protein [Bryobacteraceae bacterium]